MPYGTIKIDTVTFTDGGVDKSVSISGLVQNPTFSGNVTITGTISGNLVRGQTVSGVIVTGTTATFSTGIFTSLTGTTSQGTTATYTSGGFTSLTGVTTSGTTANFVSGVFSTQLSGATITGNVGAFTTLTGGVTTLTSGVFAAGSAASPSITFTGDLNTGIYSPGADQVAISTGGSGRLFVDASGRVSVGENFTSAKFSIAGQGGFLTGAAAATNKGTVVIQDVGISGFTSDGGIEFKASSFGNGYGARILCLDGGELLFGNRANSSAWSERLRITSAGLVGVGTSSPNSIFSISAGAKAADNNYLFLETTDASNKLQLKTSNVSNTAWSIQSEEAGIAYRFLALNPLGGNVGIGTTSPARTLQIQATSASFGINNTGGDSLAIDPPSGGFAQIDVSGANALRFNTNGFERARIDSSGRLLVGTSDARSSFFNSGLTPQFQLEIVGDAHSSVVRNSNNSGGAILTLAKTRSGSVGGNTIVADGDDLGYISFQGADNTDFAEGASIKAVVDGTPGANDMPGRLVFSTTPDNQTPFTGPVERMRITNKGACKITEDGGIRDVNSSYHELRNNLNSEVVVIETASSSYTSFMQRNNCYTAASSSYTFFDAHSGNFNDREFHLRGDGNAFADGTWTGGGADYAEYFEWSDSNPDAEDRRGISVVLDGDKIREAVAGEDPIGVISGNPSMVGDAAWNKWSGKYLRDEYGTYIQEDYEVEDEDGNTVIQQRRKLNPAYDPEVEYVSRENRPEWDCVGLMGKLRIRKGQITGSRWIKMRDISDSVEEWLVR